MASNYSKQDTIADVAATKKAYTPSHPGLFEVVYAEGSFNSQLVATRDFGSGEVICKIEGTTPGPKKYTTVQVGRDLHIELNSDRMLISEGKFLWRRRKNTQKGMQRSSTTMQGLCNTKQQLFLVSCSRLPEPFLQPVSIV
jgi:hypothetical protein